MGKNNEKIIRKNKLLSGLGVKYFANDHLLDSFSRLLTQRDIAVDALCEELVGSALNASEH